MLPALPVPGNPTRARARAGPAVLLLAALLAGCSPLYVLRAGWEEARLLDRRRPLQAVIHDTATGPTLRDRLRLVQDARDYAVRVLGLRADGSHTSYAPVDRDTLLLVVSAAPRFRLRWKTWWFPVVGRLPYRGYFDFDDARAQARQLEGRGFDTYVRPTVAFSTLGWLPDPVLSTALRADSVAIVQTVIHEITHTTYFPSDHADFGESLATFAGHAGAVHFFCRGLADAAACRRARHRWHDARRFGRWLTGLHDRLEALYDRDLPAPEAARRKDALLARAARAYRSRVVPGFRSRWHPRVDQQELNNAWILARILYHRRLDDFRALRRATGDLPAALARLISSARRADRPWDALGRLLSQRSLRTDTWAPGRRSGGGRPSPTGGPAQRASRPQGWGTGPPQRASRPAGSERRRPRPPPPPAPPASGARARRDREPGSPARIFERILVAIDFSEPSRGALDWATRHVPDAELTLFHALEPVETPGYLARALGDELDPMAAQALDAEANLEQLASEVGREVRWRVRSGWPPREVNRAAADADADLIVVGAHTRRIWPWDEPGATVEAVAEQAERAVLVWRPPPRDPERTVLVPLALQEEERRVARTGAELAAHLEARLVLLHVLPGTFQAYLRAVSSASKTEETLRRIRASAREEMTSWLPDPFREEREWQTVVTRGRVVPQILTAAEQESADAIVMGREEGAPFRQEVLLGSNTAKVLRHANCSVLSGAL